MRRTSLKHARVKKKKASHVFVKEEAFGNDLATRLLKFQKSALKLNSADSMEEETRRILDAMEFGLVFDFADMAVVENKRLRMLGFFRPRMLVLCECRSLELLL